MATIDLRSYVVGPTGTWFNKPENFQPALLRLTEATDGLTLVGPLRVRVSVQAQNRFTVVGSGLEAIQAKDALGYVLDIPPGHSWTYPAAQLLHQAVPLPPPPPMMGTQPPPPPPPPGGGAMPAPPPGVAYEAVTYMNPGVYVEGGSRIRTNVRQWMPGMNAGVAVVIRPAGFEECDPCGPDPSRPDPHRPEDPCAPRAKKGGCGCNATPCSCGAGGHDDLPCDFAVRGGHDAGRFFPAGCEPCEPGAAIAMPPAKGPALLVRPAKGGTVRTRFYDGMIIAKEDLETDQRNVRLKRSLMNRAMGQGVVWGLDVRLDGEAVCVTPGYGVDCCGNDLIVSNAYRVETGSLVRDPAAAALVARPGPQRAGLVLEYYECPEAPRPVHGDPCATDVSRCEPSRVRETVRLRLAPPCDVDDSGPIKDFLTEIARLKADPKLTALFEEVPANSTTPAPAPRVPFTLKVETYTTSAAATVPIDETTMTPGVTPPDVPPGDRDDLEIRHANDAYGGVRVTAIANTGFRFGDHGTPSLVLSFDPATQTSTPVDNPINPVSTTPTTIVWEQALPAGVLQLQHPSTEEPIRTALAMRLSGWRMLDGAGNQFVGSTDLELTPLIRKYWDSTPWGIAHKSEVPPNARFVVHLKVPPTSVRVVGKPDGRFPCTFEACDPEGRPIFPATPPFLHPDPMKPGVAADPRVLILAALYAWLAGEMARSRAGTPQALQTQRLQLAAALYRAAWRIFYGTEPDSERGSLTDALQRLFRAWCCNLLYPGPKCLCEPHGAVIGCAVVEGGAITHVDPWGGRRWVVHYPLLAHWGQQFGIMPPDAIASKLFDMICCIASLTPPRIPGKWNVGALWEARERRMDTEAGRGSAVNLGNAYLVLDEPAGATERVHSLGLKPTRSEVLDPMAFIGKMISAATSPASAGGQPVLYTMLGLREAHLLVNEGGAEKPGDGGAPRETPPAPPAGPAPSRPTGRLALLVNADVAGRTGRGAPPVLLRPVVEAIGHSLASSLPLDVPAPVKTRLTRAGIKTSGGLLDRDPEEVLTETMRGEHAEALSDALDGAEKDVHAVLKATSEAIAALASDKVIRTRADLKKPDVREKLAELISDRLKTAKVEAAPAVVARAVEDAVK